MYGVITNQLLYIITIDIIIIIRYIHAYIDAYIHTYTYIFYYIAIYILAIAVYHYYGCAKSNNIVYSIEIIAFQNQFIKTTSFLKFYKHVPSHVIIQANHTNNRIHTRHDIIITAIIIANIIAIQLHSTMIIMNLYYMHIVGS